MANGCVEMWDRAGGSVKESLKRDEGKCRRCKKYDKWASDAPARLDEFLLRIGEVEGSAKDATRKLVDMQRHAAEIAKSTNDVLRRSTKVSRCGEHFKEKA